MKFILSVVMGFFLTADPLLGQTIMENPTACFGRHCRSDAAVAANKRVDNDCYVVNDYSISYDLNRVGCNSNPLPNSSAISIDFGNIPTNVENHRFALYSLEEIQNTVAAFGPKIRMSTIFTGSYAACPSMDSYFKASLSLLDRVYVSCGNNMTTIDFEVSQKTSRFQGYFAKDFQSDVLTTYKDFDLSKCSSDLIFWYPSAHVCKLDVDLLKLVFEQI